MRTDREMTGDNARRVLLASLVAALLVLSAPAPGALAGSPEGAERLAERLHWQPLDGPPGGNTHFLEQDHIRPRHLYVGTARGLYRSADQGDTWHLLAPPLTRDVASIAFGKPAAFACARGGTLRIEPDADEVTVIGPGCHTVAARGHTVYASRNAEQLGGDGMRLDRLDLRTPATGWVEITPPPESWAGLAERLGSDRPYLGLEDLVATPDRLLASVALSRGPGDIDRAAVQLLASDDDGASWSKVDTRLPRGLPLQRLIHDPVRDRLVALGHEHRTDGAFQPISHLARVSRDGGRTWRPLTTIEHIASPTISDVDFVGKRTILSGVDQSVLELRGRDREVARWPGPPVEGYTIGFPIDELLYDRTDPRVIYARGFLGWEGIIRSRDGGRTWTRLTGGMAAAPAANLTTHPTDAGTFVASGNLGYLPHITRDGGQSWKPLVGGSSMADEVVFDPADPDHMVMISEITDILESRDGGNRWQQVAQHFTADRVHDVAISSDGDTIYSANLGTNVSRMIGLRPGGTPLGQGENAWHNLYGSPDYAYALAAGPRNTLFASQSPRKFEDHASVWRYRPGDARDPSRWTEVLRVDGATGITDLATGPGRDPILYAGVTGGDAGVWASPDLGASWAPVHDDGFGFVTVHAVALDPTDPDTIYAAPWGAGLFRSTDAGATWTDLEAPTVSAAAILVDRTHPGRVLLGDRTRPVVWESFDRGDTWTRLIEFDPDAHYRVMAMTQASGGLYVSLLDRAGPGLAVFAGVPETGTTFRLAPDGPQIIEDLDRSALAFAEGEDGLYAIGHLRRVYRIRDDRAEDISAGLPPIGFNDVLIHEGQVLVAGGVDLDARLEPVVRDASVTHNIYRRVGDGWEPMLEGDPFKSPIKQLEADPERPGLLHAATATGLYVSADGGRTWQPQTDGLSVADVGSLAVIGDRVVAGTLGGGVSVADRITPEQIAWRPSAGPRPEIANVRIVTHPRKASKLWASAYPGGVFRSSDGGGTWTESNFGLPSFEVVDPLLQGYYSLAVDPTQPSTLYLAIGGHGLFRSTDGAATWLPLGRYGEEPELMASELRNILVDPDDPRQLWLATSDRGVFRSRDGGNTWRALNKGLKTMEVLTLERTRDGDLLAGTAGHGVYRLPKGAGKWRHLGDTIGIGEWLTWDRRLYQYSALLFDPAHPARLLLGHFPGGFFVSSDGGRSWRSSNMGVGNDGIFSLVSHPRIPERLFAGSYNGILRSDDGGATWRDTSKGMPPEQWSFAIVIDDRDPELMYVTTKNGQNKGFCDRNMDTFCGVVMRSSDGGRSWARIMEGLPQTAEFYMLELDPRDHDVLYLSSSRGVFVSADGGGHWAVANGELPVEEFFVRDNVAQNMKLTADGRHLLLGVVGQGIWRAELPDLSFRD